MLHLKREDLYYITSLSYLILLLSFSLYQKVLQDCMCQNYYNINRIPRGWLDETVAMLSYQARLSDY